MAFKISISARAERNLADLLNYLEEKWSKRVKSKYLKILEGKVKLISENPFIYQVSIRRKLIYRCVVTKQSVMYYRIVDQQVEIITIQDSRRETKKINF